MNYYDFRHEHTAACASGEPIKWRLPVINNTGNSRQVRRARERDREGPIRLSNRLETALGYLDEGQGLFMRVKRLRGYMPYRDYARGWAHERREPSEDYSKRYQALFNVLPGAAVHS